jgi:MHS family proline/betaine transporter-like MFS transporter
LRPPLKAILARTPGESPRAHAKALALAVSASIAEGYDTALFGVYAVVVGRLFFAEGNEAAGLLRAVGAFAAGYLMRPIGALVLGGFADRRGRKRSVALVVTIMSLSTGVIGLLPTYARIGLAAPLVVVGARLVQGFVAGGGSGVAAVYVAELAGEGRRGFFVSLNFTSQVASYLFSTLVGALIFALPAGAVDSWGWRLPFLLALVLGPFGFYIRAHSEETRAFQTAAASPGESPFREALRRFKGRTLLTIALGGLHQVASFMLLLFMPPYASHQLGIPMQGALSAGAVSAVLMMLAAPLGGMAADRFGLKRVVFVSAAASLLCAYPAFAFLASHPTVPSLIFVQGLLAVLAAPACAVDNALKVQLFPTRLRATCMSLADSANTLILGALGSLAVTWWMGVSGDQSTPAYYLMGGAALTLLALIQVTPARRLEIPA